VILLLAVLAGILLGILRAWHYHVPWQPPRLDLLGLVPLGFSLQFFAIYLPYTRSLFPDWLAGLFLVASQAILLGFCLLNIRKPGLVLMATGLALNLVAIIFNGGFMPLPVETARSMLPPPVFEQLEVGGRVGVGSKDVLLPQGSIALPWLADRFVSPAGFLKPFLFSIGDVLVALGVLLLLSQPTRPDASHQEMNHAR